MAVDREDWTLKDRQAVNSMTGHRLDSEWVGVGLAEVNSGTRYFRLEVSLAGPTGTGLLSLPLRSPPRAQAEGGGSGRCRGCTCTGRCFPHLDLEQNHSPSPRPRNTTWRKPGSLFRCRPRFAFPDLGICNIPRALLRVSLFISCLNQTALLWGWCRGEGASV